MYQKWSFFRALIDNLQMALAKADLVIAKEYLELVEEPSEAERIFQQIQDEMQLTKKHVLQITRAARTIGSYSGDSGVDPLKKSLC